MKKILFLLFPFILLASSQKVSIQLEWKHQFEFAGLYAAIEKGYYKDIGLDVELKEFKKGIDISKDVINGKSTFGFSSSSLILDKLQNEPIVLLASYFKQNALALVTNKSIKNINDLKNKKIMAMDYEIEHTSIGVMLDDNGLKKGDYTLVEHDFSIDKFVNGEVEAMSIFITNQPFLLDKKNISYNILNPSEYGFYTYDCELFTSESFAKKNYKLVQKFIDASNKGWEYAFKNKQEIVDLIYNKYSKEKSKDALMFEAKEVEKLFKTNIFKIGSIVPELLELNARIYDKLGLINENVDVRKVLKSFLFTSLNKKTEVFEKNKINKYDNIINYKLIFEILLIASLILIATLFWIRKLSVLNKELLFAKNKADEARNTKTVFLANMSHEIRTPMNSILGMSYLIKETKLNRIQYDYIQKIESSSNNLLQLINDILDFSKIEAKKLALQKLDFNLIDVLNSVENSILIDTYEKGLEFITHYNKSDSMILYGDSLRLTQILINLTSNAVKFTQEGKVELFVKKLNAKRFKFEIKDTGIGLTSKEIKNIFSSFTQADSSTTRKYGGTGLGLTISKELIELMNGKIWVESTIGKGSDFIFEIDLEVSENEKNTTSENHKKEYKNENKIKLNERMAEELFIRLQDAIKKRRPQLCSPILKEFANYSLSQEIQELFDEVNSLIIKYKFDEARKILDER